ncbi:MAG: hypothetical protein RMJ43_00045 [Chloroherpetonaceae bacterium]|nr:hypothetical protein [Chthonomonadaceae bacterium]MDW8206198.1 hypothetical protein [Chloroherpetonaceae bacterium]
MSTSRQRTPGLWEQLRTLLINTGAAFVTLQAVFALFGSSALFPGALLRHASFLDDADFRVLLVPGAASAYTVLWRWLIAQGGRTALFPWGAAALYGVGIAFASIPFSGFLLGVLRGNPLLGLLLALASLLLLPALSIAMTVFGLLMGLLNGYRAYRWLRAHYRPRD